MRKLAIAISLVALFLGACAVASRFVFHAGTGVPIQNAVWFTAGPLLIAMAAFRWPTISLLRWIALIVNSFHGLLMLYLFGSMLLLVSPPPSITSVIPVALFGLVYLVAPLANAVALSPGVWRGANNSFKPKPLRGSA